MQINLSKLLSLGWLIICLSACNLSSNNITFPNSYNSPVTVRVGFLSDKSFRLIAEIYAQTLELNKVPVERVALKPTKLDAIQLVQSGIVDLLPITMQELLAKLGKQEGNFPNVQQSKEDQQVAWDSKAIGVLPQGISVGDRLDFSLPLGRESASSFNKVAPLYRLSALPKYPTRAINRVAGELTLNEFLFLLSQYKQGANLTQLVSNWCSQRILIG